MRSLLSLGLGTALALAYAPLAAGQAIIGYGINVGRAGTAGAATGAAGAGAAGIFKRLKGTLDAESETKPSQASTTERKPEFDKAPVEKPEESAANRPAKPVFKSSGEVKTESGVKISGLTPVTAPRRWAEPEPAQAWVPMPPGPAPSAPAPAPSQASASAAGAPSASAGNPEPAPASAPAPAAAASGDGADGLPVVERGVSHPGITQARIATVYPNRPPRATQTTPQADVGSEPTVGPEPAGYSVVEIIEGTLISDVIERFGKPLMRMVGIPRDGYSEKYLFRAPDGSRFAVLALDGRVVRVLADRSMPSHASR